MYSGGRLLLCRGLVGISVIDTLCTFNGKVYPTFPILGVIAKKQVKEFWSNYLAAGCIIPRSQRLYRSIDLDLHSDCDAMRLPDGH